MPELQVLYEKNSKGQNYEEAQRQITEKEDYAQLGNFLIPDLFGRNEIKNSRGVYIVPLINHFELL